MCRDGDIVGPYKLLEFLGEGSFGEVWKAIETDGYSREVAIKFTKGSWVDQAKFELEAKTWVPADIPSFAPVNTKIRVSQRTIPSRKNFSLLSANSRRADLYKTILNKMAVKH